MEFKDVYTDGLYTLVYMVFDTIDPLNFKYYLSTQNKAFYCNSECCVTNMFAKLIPSNCECDDVNLEQAQAAKGMLDSLIASAKTGKKDNFSNILKVLNRMCHICKCGCGNNNKTIPISLTNGNCGCS